MSLPEENTEAEEAVSETASDETKVDSEENETPEEASESTEVESEPELSPLEQKTQEVAKLKDRLLRTAADFDNYRKRARRDVTDAEKQTKSRTIMALLPVIDDLHRALQSAEKATDIESVTTGVKMVLRSFDDVAEKLELKRVETEGAVFDPTVHDAVQQIATDEQAPGTIVAEITGGYLLGERLLRPAMVVVAKPTEKEPEES